MSKLPSQRCILIKLSFSSTCTNVHISKSLILVDNTPHWQILITDTPSIPWRHQLLPFLPHFVIKSNHPCLKAPESASKSLGTLFHQSLITKDERRRNLAGLSIAIKLPVIASLDALVDDLHTFGFKVIHFVFIPIVVCALTRVFITTDFPPPVDPTIIVQCLVNIVSYNWITLSTLWENKRWREGKKKREWVNRRNKDMSCGPGGATAKYESATSNI